MSTIQSQVWSGNKKKIAREETIINQYRKIYNRQSIPQDKQYWTMCGDLSDKKGNINHDSEYSQIIREGLIIPKQFRGVEVIKELYDNNVDVLSNIEFYNDDFFKTLNRQANQNQFKPAIVNADLINMPEIGAIYISKIIALLSMMPGEIMLVANLVLDSPYISPTRKKQDIDRFLVNLKNQHKFNAFKHHWNFNNECYKYAGNREHSRISMGSYIFWK
jgi:hypothetical protein